MPAEPTPKSSYASLVEKVDLKFDEILQSQRAKINCKQGCHSCCQPNLTVFSIERNEIKAYLDQKPAVVEKLHAIALENPHKGQRCSFLSADGKCQIYPVRPIICRTHGAPIFVIEDEGMVKDVCNLNFDGGTGLESVPADKFININLLNSLLVLINAQVDPKGERFALTIDGLLGKA